MNVMTKKEALSFLLAIIENNKFNKPLVVAIDGRSSSGKTTFAAELQEITGIPVVHTDDFFRPRNPNGDIEMSEFCGNFDIDRFKREVVDAIARCDDLTIGIFDCKVGKITKNISYPRSKAYIIEGAYSHHPDLGNYIDVSLFFEVDHDEQLKRIERRNGSERLRTFQALWIPAEERYFEKYEIKNNCDFVVID